MSDRGGPPRQRMNTPGIPGERLSRDNVELVLAEERAAKREGELLAQMAGERQAAAQRIAEFERLARQAEQRQASSVPPKAEAGAFDIRGRVTLAQFLTTVAGIGGLVASAVTFFKTQTPPPQIVDNSAPIRVLTAQLSTQAQRVQALTRHTKELEDWVAIAIEASCVDVVRLDGARALPGALVNSGNVKRRCPVVRLENPQPVLPGNLDEPLPAAQPPP